MTLKRCVFVESNTTGTGEILLNKALAEGYEVLFLTATPSKYRFLESRLVHVIKIDTRNPQAIYCFIAEFDAVECLMSTSEYYIHVCAQVCALLGLPSNTADAIACCRDKFALATRLTEAKVLTPDTQLLSPKKITAHELTEEVAASIVFPCVLKPVSSSGSIGVQRIQNTDELKDYIQQTKEQTVLCQEYIEGAEYSVESFSIGGQHYVIGVTQKHLGYWPFFVETGHDFPADLNRGVLSQINETAQKTLDAVGFRFGPAHIEIRISKGKSWVIEVNPRLAGGMIPALIKQSCNDDPLDLLFDLYRGDFAHWMTKENTLSFKSPERHTSIRFRLADKRGKIAAISIENTESDHLKDITLIKQSGDMITSISDFSSRVAYAIGSGASIETAAKEAAQKLENVQIAIKSGSDEISDILAERISNRLNHTGRLTSTLDPRAQAILVNSNPLAQDEITLISQIDEAHILMLHKQGLLKTDASKQLLESIKALQKNNFHDIRKLEHPRGVYLSYEAYLCEKQGDHIGGQLQLGRSRNDLNATVNAMQLRKMLLKFTKQCWRFTSTLIHKALQHKKTLLPIYSQYQIALPGTYGHYLAGIADCMIETLQQLQHLDATQFRCPLGAGAGGGTALPIDPEHTAKYLGFTSHQTNALMSVSSRASNLRVFGEIQACVLLMSRIAQDLQFMSSREVALIALPDNLCGGSSSMPQKKNPYLLEWVKAMVSEITADHQCLFSTLGKTPFSNSYEVSSVFARKTQSIFNRAYQVISMMSLLIEGAEVNHERSKTLIESEFTWATYITEALAVQNAQSFRSAHHYVGEVIAEKMTTSHDESMQAIFTQFVDNNIEVSAETIVEKIHFGGGPSSIAVTSHLFDLSKSLRQSGEYLEKVDAQLQKAEIARKLEIRKFSSDMGESKICQH